MDVTELDLPPEVAETLAARGIKSLYPPQAKAAPLALSGKNLVLAIPTASGKSLIAYMAIIKSMLAGEKAIYIVPLRALAQEKYEDLKAFSALGFKVAVTTGDYDGTSEHLAGMDAIVCTSEKADSLVRHGTRWMSNLGVIVVDEVHLMNDPGRGPTIEVLLTRLRRLNPRAQVIALSATIRNSRDIALWLGAEHVESDWRPVELKEGVLLDGTIHFSNGQEREVPERKDQVLALVEDTVREGGQCLLFVNTRKSAQSMAASVSRMLKGLLGKEAMEGAKELASEIEGAEEVTSMGKKLEACVASGAAFHHAGLTNSQRGMVERAFKQGRIKCIAATPTLAAGINLPARRVIVRDLRRFDISQGSVPLPVLEVKQMCGRAGRPGLDPYGEAVLLAKRADELEALMERYILAEPEEIQSKLATESALRTHLLALIATNAAGTEQELARFMDDTFLSFQGRLWSLEAAMEEMLGFLARHELITVGSRLEATALGKRCSDLYLDPLSAVTLKGALEGSRDRDVEDLALLHAICSTPDMPVLYLRSADHVWLEAAAEGVEGKLLVPPDDDAGYNMHLAALKTAHLLNDWMGERSEDDLTERFNVGPGDIHKEVEMADWLLYSMGELAQLLHAGPQRQIKALSARMRYGVKPELLDLVELRGVGRKRARLLFNAGFQRRDSIVGVPPAAIMRATGLGKKVAEDIVQQVEKLVHGV